MRGRKGSPRSVVITPHLADYGPQVTSSSSSSSPPTSRDCLDIMQTRWPSLSTPPHPAFAAGILLALLALACPLVFPSHLHFPSSSLFTSSLPPYLILLFSPSSKLLFALSFLLLSVFVRTSAKTFHPLDLLCCMPLPCYMTATRKQRSQVLVQKTLQVIRAF